MEKNLQKARREKLKKLKDLVKADKEGKGSTAVANAMVL